MLYFFSNLFMLYRKKYLINHGGIRGLAFVGRRIQQLSRVVEICTQYGQGHNAHKDKSDKVTMI